MKENGGIYLSECKVNNKEVRDQQAEDGWYHYGVRDLINEEYVDMYGDALKKASLIYYQTNGVVVEDYHTLLLDYKGKDVGCDVTMNYDGSIYMTHCKVNGIDVLNENEEDGYYHYGEYKLKSYSVGDEVSYNNVDYYVIVNNGTDETSVTLLKKDPLTIEEVNNYGIVHVNRYVGEPETAYNNNGYGGLAYYSSETCGYVNDSWVSRGCITNYDQSDVKYVVDGWAQSNTNLDDLAVDYTEYKARLITWEDLVNNL